MKQDNLWRNWGRTVAANPLKVARPASVDEVVAVVRAAAAEGMRVKAIGAGHSFTAIAEAAGVQVNLDALSGLVRVDRDSRQVTLRAGTRLRDVPALLAPHALAMENLGDIDAQSIAGAISTGTHGTGARFRGIAAQVAGVLLVTGQGDLLRVDAEHNPDLLPAVALGLGALGILVEVTLACVDAFDLSAVERPVPLAELIGSLPKWVAESDHFEFYWFPHTRTALTKVNTRLPAGRDRAPLSPARRWFDDRFMANEVFRVSCALGKLAPATVPWINKAAEHLTGNRSFSDASTSVFTTRRSVRFTESEYAIPAAHAAEAFAELSQLIERNRWRISFPVEVRFAAADTLWMSTAYGRDTAYLAVHRVVGEDPTPYFRAVEAIMSGYGGRPHWGKLHWRRAEDLAPAYPHFDDFRALRSRIDPQGLFLNAHLDRVLGTG